MLQEVDAVAYKASKQELCFRLQTMPSSRLKTTAAVWGGVDFLQRLALQLDCEDPDWRNDTLLVLDGAKTHRSEETRRAMAALQLPVMIAGPYGFDGMPAETVFSLLKVGELNPWRTATGKR